MFEPLFTTPTPRLDGHPNANTILIEYTIPNTLPMANTAVDNTHTILHAPTKQKRIGRGSFTPTLEPEHTRTRTHPGPVGGSVRVRVRGLRVSDGGVRERGSVERSEYGSFVGRSCLVVLFAPHRTKGLHLKDGSSELTC